MGRNDMLCNKCGHKADAEKFIDDYIWSDSLDDEVPVYKCPGCGWSDSVTLKTLTKMEI